MPMLTEKKFPQKLVDSRYFIQVSSFRPEEFLVNPRYPTVSMLASTFSGKAMVMDLLADWEGALEIFMFKAGFFLILDLSKPCLLFLDAEQKLSQDLGFSIFMNHDLVKLCELRIDGLKLCLDFCQFFSSDVVYQEFSGGEYLLNARHH